MRTRADVVLFLLAAVVHPATAQDIPDLPPSARLRALAINSIAGPIPVHFSRSLPRGEADDLRSLMTACVAKYRDAIPVRPGIMLAILDSADWERVAVFPYGLPHYEPADSPVVVVVPATAPKMFLMGVEGEQTVQFFRLLALHELGHILMYAAVGVDPGQPWDQTHFPFWYYEYTATHIGFSCLSRPEDIRAWGPTDSAFRAFARPQYTQLDQWTELMTRTTDAGEPFALTPAGLPNFAWYQSLLDTMARRTVPLLGPGIVPLLRAQWTRTGPVSTIEIVADLSSSDPGLAAWLRAVGAIN
jgi:hypothetical protein